jgi:NAD(P)-dependent dehydrogenase (short-subunit alcohol dehydrogenase family)
MQVAGKVVVVTGGANGIGKALCEAVHKAGAAKVVVVDLDHAHAEAVATSIGGAAFKCDVGQEKNLLQCRHRRRFRSAVGQCRRQLR